MAVTAAQREKLEAHRDALTATRAGSEWNTDDRKLRDAILDIIEALTPAPTAPKPPKEK